MDRGQRQGPEQSVLTDDQGGMSRGIDGVVDYGSGDIHPGVFVVSPPTTRG